MNIYFKLLFFVFFFVYFYRCIFYIFIGRLFVAPVFTGRVRRPGSSAFSPLLTAFCSFGSVVGRQSGTLAGLLNWNTLGACFLKSKLAKVREGLASIPQEFTHTDADYWGKTSTKGI